MLYCNGLVDPSELVCSASCQEMSTTRARPSMAVDIILLVLRFGRIVF
jgi:hypothetical protein